LITASASGSRANEVSMANDDKIRALAHQLWLDDGQPEGKEKEHWDRASAMLSAKAKPPAAKKPAAEGTAAKKPAEKKPAETKPAETKPAAPKADKPVKAAPKAMAKSK
jgi:hypothetical protein